MKPDDYPKAQENPRFPDAINAPPQSLFRELILLTLSVATGFLLVAVLIWQSLGWLSQFIPISWENRLIEPFSGQWVEPGPEQARLQQRVDNLLYLLAEPDLSVRVHLLESEQVNAFATLGAQVFVTKGLLDALETPVGLDFVLLHELAHLLHRDPIRATAGELGVRLLLALATGQGDLPVPGFWLQSSRQLLRLHYSREQERAADLRALQALLQRYDDLTDADELFVYLQSVSGADRVPQMLSTHPHTDVRIETIRRFVEENSTGIKRE